MENARIVASVTEGTTTLLSYLEWPAGRVRRFIHRHLKSCANHTQPRLCSTVLIEPMSRALALTVFLFLLSINGLAQKPELVVQTGHSSAVKNVWFSPDETHLVSQSEDRLVFWDVKNQTILREVKDVEAFYVSPDNHTVATESRRYGTLTLWNINTGVGLFTISRLKDWSFSPDGKKLATIDSTNGLRIWNIPAKTVRTNPLPNKASLLNCVFGLQGDVVVLSTRDDQVQIVDLSSHLTTSIKQIASFGVSPDGQFLIVNSRQNDLQVIALVETKKPGAAAPYVRFTHANVSYWSLSPDGTFLTVEGPDNSLKVFETKTGVRKLEFPGGNIFYQAIFSPNGRVFTNGPGTFDLDSGKTLPPIQRFENIYYSDTSPNGRTRLLTGAGPLFILWDVYKGALTLKKTQKSGYHLISSRFSPDGSLLATLQDNFIDKRVSVSIWDSQTGQERQLVEFAKPADVVAGEGVGAGAGPGFDGPKLISLVTPTRRPQSGELAFNSNGHLLVVGYPTGDVVVRNTITAKTSAVLKGRASILQAVFTSHDEGLNIYDDGGSVRFWDLESGRISDPRVYQQPTYTYNNNKDYLQNYADGLYTLSDRKTGQPILKVANVQSCDISPDNKLVSCLQTTSIKERYKLTVWDISTKTVLFTKEDVEYGMRFSPDSEKLVTERQTDGRKQFDVWRISSNKLLLSVPVADSGAQYGFSPDSKGLAITKIIDSDSVPGLPIAVSKYSLETWSLTDGSKTFSVENIYGHRFNHDWSRLAVELADRLKLWDFKTQTTREFIYPEVKRYFHLTLREELGWYESHFSPKEDLVVSYSKKSVASLESHSVLLWDTKSNELYTLTGHSATITNASFSSGDRYLATSSEDGTIKLWNTNDGTLALTLVLLNESDWLVTTPDGFFDGTPEAWKQLLWRFNKNGLDDRPVETYFNDFFYPNLLHDVLAGHAPKLTGRELEKIDRRQPNVRISAINGQTNLVDNSQSRNELPVSKRTATVTIQVANNGDQIKQSGTAASSGAQDVRLFRNGALVKVWHGDVLKGQDSIELEAMVPIVAGENRLTAYAFNHDNIKSNDATVTITGSSSLKRKGVAYLLTVGVNQYANAQYNLKYAVADATDFAEELKRQQTKLGKYERIQVLSLNDNEATKANILKVLTDLRAKIQPEDAVIIFFAGHGTAQGNRFYLIPHDLGYNGNRKRIDEVGLQAILSHSISDEELERAIEGINPGLLLLVIDTCNSGQALEAEEKRRGPMNSKGLAQLAYEKGMYILTAAQSYQAAVEAAKLGHGYLTYALVEEGLKTPAADIEPKDNQLLLREWLDYATYRVPTMQQETIDQGARGVGLEVVFIEGDEMAKDFNKRALQRPRVFYRREREVNPVVIAKQQIMSVKGAKLHNDLSSVVCFLNRLLTLLQTI